VAGVAALLAVLGARLAGRAVGAADPVPFGAFLAFGFWWVWLYGPVAI
jgi:prepilin signal peptidase PulO-like enzyme (type II secretory pathway)